MAGLRGDPVDPASDMAVRREVEARFRRDMGVGEQSDIREAEPIADEEIAPGEMPVHHRQRGDSRLALGGQLAALRGGGGPGGWAGSPTKASQKRKVAILGS